MKLGKEKYLETRNIKPSTIFFSLLAINLLLAAIVYIFPEEGMDLGEDYTLKFTSPSSLWSTDTQSVAQVELDSVLQGVIPVETEDSVEVAVIDSMNSIDSAIAQYLSIPTYRQIVISDSNPQALAMLINALKVESKTKVVRILHYGDSQIEGDRITNYLRHRIQKTFGGKGAGILLPKEPAANSRRNFLVKESDNLTKYAIYGKNKEPNREYGIGGTAYRVNGPHSRFTRWDTIVQVDTSLGTETVSILPRYTDSLHAKNYFEFQSRYMGYANARRHSKITLLYKSDSPCEIELTNDGAKSTSTLRPSSSGLRTWNKWTNKSVRFSIVDGKFPSIYGVALDGNTGVAVDNFGMRGSSGQGFSSISRSLYRKQLRQLNVRAVIMQYGVNVVPNEISNYDYYKRTLKNQIASIQLAYPGISILIVGPNDMSRNVEGEYVSYENIPKINKAMKETALESGCGFWDLYTAMGGRNAMTEWVNQGLAQKDYTHFTYDGAKYVGEMLYEAIMNQVYKDQNPM